MERSEQYPSRYFIPELIEDEDIIFNKDSEYHKQKKKEISPKIDGRFEEVTE